jgi:hypothetical protein
VIVDSRPIYCLTFDEFYSDPAFRLEKYGPAALADAAKKVPKSPRGPRRGGPGGP